MLPERFGPFVLLKKLGAGGMGDAHLARPAEEDPALPPIVVVKRLHSELASSDRAVRRFQHEAAIATSIESPHLARVYSAGQVGETLYIAMEYINGWPLSRVLMSLREEGRQISIPSAVDLVSDALRGIWALHSAKDERGSPLAAVHRDVSPKNLMLGEDGRVRVIDLGLGKSRLQDWHTRTGSVMGTPGYMAPEQVLAGAVDHRTDLYALGIVLFEVLTLEPYIAWGPVAAVLKESLRPRFRPPSSLRDDVPVALDRICQRALALEPGERFESASDFLRALTEARNTKAAREPARTLVNELLLAELTQSRVEAYALLASTPSAEEEAEPLAPTLVFARRSPGINERPTVQPAAEIANTLPLESSVLPRPLASPPSRSLGALKASGALAALVAALFVGMRIERASQQPPIQVPVEQERAIAVEPTARGAPSAAPASAKPLPASASPLPPSAPAPRPTPRPTREPRATASASPGSPEPSAQPPAPRAPRSPLDRREDEAVDRWLQRVNEALSSKIVQTPEQQRALEDAQVALSRLRPSEDPAILEQKLKAIIARLE